MVGLLVGASSAPAAGSADLVISQVYGGGGNSNATFANDYIEIFNRGTTAASLNGRSVQYASATGTGNFGGASNLLTVLPDVSLDAGHYFLIQEASTAAVGAPVPGPDLIPAIPINMAAGAGKVALVNGTTSLGCNGGSTACSAAQLASIVDLVGYGTGSSGANFFEGTGQAPTISATAAALRRNGGCTDTDNNSADFTAGAPTPRNTSVSRAGSPRIAVATTPANPAPGTDVTVTAAVAPGTNPTSTSFSVTCDLTFALLGTADLFDDGTNGDATPNDLVFSRRFTIPPATTAGPKVGACSVVDDLDRTGTDSYSVNVTPVVSDLAPTLASHTPGTSEGNVAVDANVGITFSERVDPAGSWFSIVCTPSGAHSAVVTNGPTAFLLDPAVDFAPGETCTVTLTGAQISDQDTIDPPDTVEGNPSWSFTVAAPPVAIHDIQGAAHISPKAGQTVSGVRGIVTALGTNGFWMQDPNADTDPATSEGIFVFTSSRPSVAVGDLVSVSARVQEFRPGGATNGNLTTTELASATVSVLSSGNSLPAPTVVGDGGRVPPNQIIENDATSGSVETSGTFDPSDDGLDFWESLEGMRVQVNDAVAVGPTNSFGETPIVGDGGRHAGPRTIRGGVLLRPDDGNPERVVADDSLTPMPNLNVGDGYSGPIVGVLDYNFGNPFIEVTSTVQRVDNHLQREVAADTSPSELAVATFNFENLDTTDPPAKFAQLAAEIVTNLKSPDVIAGEEVQDDNGPADTGTVGADQTLNELVAAIQAAGGPTYEYRYINPVNDQDGGEPGGNIRQVFLFRTDRGVSFVDRPGGDSTTATTVVNGAGGPELSASPGRIAPGDAAFTASRKPLAGEFLVGGRRLFVIANHFNSKGGDQPLLGRFQPPQRPSETQRHQQAQIVHDFVASILAADPNADVVVDGDLNDFEFSDTDSILKGTILDDLIETLPLNERYTYVFEGNSQTLDHILLTKALSSQSPAYDVVHVNSEFADQPSDHEPSVVRLAVKVNAAPTADAGGPYTVAEGGS